MALAIGTATIGSAQASTLLPLIDLSNTFGDLSGAFAENGYTVVFAPFNGGNIFNNPGVELAPRTPDNGGQVIITATDMSVFAFVGIDIIADSGSPNLTVQGLLNGVTVATDILNTSSGTFVTANAVSLNGLAVDELIITGDRNDTNAVGFANLQVGPVPEPASIALFLGGAAVLGAARRRQAR